MNRTSFMRGLIDGLSKIANGDEEETGGKAPSQDAVIKFLDRHPNPTDDQFHEWAESQGYNVHKAEQTAYRILSDIVNKGKSKGKVPPGVTPKMVAEGVKVEKEHTPNPSIARKITLDHQAEHRDYYPALKKMEKNLEKEGQEEEPKKKESGVSRALGTLSFIGAGLIGGKKPQPIGPTKKGTIVKPTGALRSKLGPMPKMAAFMEGLLDELEKHSYRSLGGGAISTGGFHYPKSSRVAGGGVRTTTGTGSQTIIGSKAGSKATRAPLNLKTGLPKGLKKVASPPTLSKLRRAYPKGKVKPQVANPIAPKGGPQFPKAATLSGRAKYLLKRLAAPIRRIMAEHKGQKAMDKGETRKALRYGGVSAGLGPSFGREPKKAKRLVKGLDMALAKT